MSEQDCTVAQNITIGRGTWADYESLGRYHYLGGPCRPFAGIFVMRDAHPVRRRFVGVVGVIVYTMPSPALAIRNFVTSGAFCGLGDHAVSIQKLNRSVRRISRVIIDPRYRGLGLASRLVAETMPMMNVAMIEAIAAMGKVNPFFAKAGMRAYEYNAPARCIRMAEAFETVGIAKQMFVDPQAVQQEYDALKPVQRRLIDAEINRFLQAYGKRRNMPAGLERTRYVLARLGGGGVYYVWLNDPIDRIAP